MSEEYDLDALTSHPHDPDEPLGSKVDRLTDAMKGLVIAWGREKKTARRVRNLGLAVVGVVAAVAAVAVMVGAVSYRQSSRLDTVLDQSLADRNQRRIDGCVLNNQARAANRGLVELDRQSSILFAQVLVDPALGQAQGRPERTPEEEAATQRLLEVFTGLYTKATDPLRQQILSGLKDVDCSPEALGISGPTGTSTPSSSTED